MDDLPLARLLVPGPVVRDALVNDKAYGRGLVHPGRLDLPAAVRRSVDGDPRAFQRLGLFGLDNQPPAVAQGQDAQQVGELLPLGVFVAGHLFQGLERREPDRRAVGVVTVDAVQ